MQITVTERNGMDHPIGVKMVSENLDEAYILAALGVELLDTREDDQNVICRSFSGIMGFREESQKDIPNEILLEIV